VTIPAAPQRIVTLSPAATEILFAIGAGDRVAGKVQDIADFPAAAHDLPEVATFAGVDVEKIVALRADLVLADTSLTKPAPLQRLSDVGIPVVELVAPDVAGVLADIRLVGRATGADAAAGDLVASMQAQIDQIKAATRDLPHPRTFYEIEATKDIFGPTDGSPVVDMITLVGGQPVTTGSPTVASIPLEKLVAADPEVIVLGDSAYGTTPDAVKARAGWSSIAAVKTGAIRPIDDIVVTRPGPRLVDGLRALALAIHPDLVLPPAPSASPPATPAASPTASPAASATS
jgi:cobalamin transport system substrate-binding protein